MHLGHAGILHERKQGHPAGKGHAGSRHGEAVTNSDRLAVEERPQRGLQPVGPQHLTRGQRMREGVCSERKSSGGKEWIQNWWFYNILLLLQTQAPQMARSDP